MLRRSLWERRLFALGDQIGRLAITVAKLERQVEVERKQTAANTETLNLLLLRVTQRGHDMQLRDTPVVPLRHTRKRPLG